MRRNFFDNDFPEEDESLAVDLGGPPHDAVSRSVGLEHLWGFICGEDQNLELDRVRKGDLMSFKVSNSALQRKRPLLESRFRDLAGQFQLVMEDRVAPDENFQQRCGGRYRL